VPSRALLLLVFAAVHAADLQTSRLSSTTVAEIEQFIQRLVDTHELPGAVLLLARDGTVVSERAFGDADIESHRPMRTDTLFRLASAAKIATTVGVLILQDEGRLSLDDPLERHLPEFRNARVMSGDGSTRAASRSLTVRDLLRHTSGYGYGNDDRQRERYRDAGVMPKTSESSWAHTFTLDEWVTRIAAVPLASDPGSKFEYGLGADIAGALIERVSANSLDRFLQQRVFGPLGMKDTAFVVDASQASRLSSVYRIDKGTLSRLDHGEQSPFRRRPRALSGGGGWTNLGTGGLVTTASDFYRLLQAILNRGELNGVRLLSGNTAEQMFTNQLSSTGTPERLPGVGFGLGLAVVTDGARYGLPGSEGLMFWAGSLNTRYWIFPRERLIGIYLTQVEPFPYRDLMNVVMKMSLQATAR